MYTMSYTIAVAGKGGTGKTTLCGLMIRYLLTHGRSPVLAVDADANANLHEVLGIEKGVSVGQLREKAMVRQGTHDRRPSARAAAMTRKPAFVLAASF